MSLLACGLNYKTAPLSVREQLVIPPDDLSAPLLELIEQCRASEVAILSTCNRTEFYTDGMSQAQMLDWLTAKYAFNVSDISPHLYFYPEEQAVKHVMRVASGLDSMVLGEPQILGQMKQAFKCAAKTGTLGPQLQRLFQYVFTTCKQIRTDTAVGAHPISVAYVAVNLAKRIFTDLTQSTALLIGAGDTMELAAKHLYDQRIGNIIVANRTVLKARSLASHYQGKGIAIAEIPAHIENVDIIITATASQLPIIGKGMIERALKARRHKPMLILDLAVPRDVEAQVSELSGVFLYCVDDLQKVITDNLSDRQQAAKQAEEIVELQTCHFMNWLRSLDSVNMIREFREGMQKMRDQEIQKALQALTQGEPAQEVIQNLGRALMNKYMHQPSVDIKQAAYDGDLEKLALLKQILNLKGS